MGLAGEHEGGQGICPILKPDSELGVAPDGDRNEVPSSPPEHFGDAIGPALGSSAEGQRQDTEEVMDPDRSLDVNWLQHILSKAVLINPGNWCFANSAIMAYLWTTLTLRNFTFSIWGEHCNDFHTFVTSLHEEAGQLSYHGWFRYMLQCWGRSDLSLTQGLTAQQDAAEFVGVLLDCIGTETVDMSWERRLMENDQVHVVDRCEGRIPLWLQFDDIYS